MMKNHEDNWPQLPEYAKARLQHLREAPDAPQFTGQSGARLQPAELDRLMKSKPALQADPQPFPDWLAAFVHQCLTQVPHYRSYATEYAGRSLETLPCVTRADLSADIGAFVPDNLPLDELIAYETSGTTGHPLVIPSHPRVAARYHCFHEKALRWHGVDLRGQEGTTGVVLAGFQKRCFTYVSVIPYWGYKGLVKLNLHPDDWPEPRARQRYLDALKPILVSGDPCSFFELLAIELKHTPKALLSTSMTLLEGLRQQLESAFECPVVDCYSMNEAGPIAATDGRYSGMRLLQPNLHVEIVNRRGEPQPLGVRGEVCLSGGFNDYLPLLRYRTGDYASLWRSPEGHLYLKALSGRPPVRFYTQSGWINNVDMTHRLQPFALSQFQLHQNRDGSVALRLSEYCDQHQLMNTLTDAFGPNWPIEIQHTMARTEKVVQYTSDFPGGLCQ